SINISVKNCAFLPNESVSSYSACPFGNHAVGESAYTNILFENNYVENVIETGENRQGGLHFSDVEDLEIVGNKFVATNNDNVSISLTENCFNTTIKSNTFLNTRSN